MGHDDYVLMPENTVQTTGVDVNDPPVALTTLAFVLSR